MSLLKMSVILLADGALGPMVISKGDSGSGTPRVKSVIHFGGRSPTIFCTDLALQRFCSHNPFKNK